MYLCGGQAGNRDECKCWSLAWASQKARGDSLFETSAFHLLSLLDTYPCDELSRTGPPDLFVPLFFWHADSHIALCYVLSFPGFNCPQQSSWLLVVLEVQLFTLSWRKLKWV